MATAAVSIAPVLTPQALGVLADTLERADLPEKALSLRSLQPFVQSVVERYFVPLSAPPQKGRFTNRFTKLAKDFEPFRLYLNLRLLGTLGNQEFLSFYQRALRDLLVPLLKTAHEMDMGPELISAIIRDYMKILATLAQPADTPPAQAGEMTIEQFTGFVEWFRAATRLDYALTAIFLVLERSIPKPTVADKGALLSSSKRALVEFGRATSRVIVHEHVQRILRELETPNIEAPAIREALQDMPSARVARAPRGPLLALSPRQSEVNWLKRNKQLSEEYGGQWIVLEKDELIAHDVDYKTAREAATRRGIRRPFIIFVPRKESGGFMGI